MKKWVAVLAVVILLILAMIFWGRRLLHQDTPSGSVQLPGNISVADLEAQEAPPLPDISLQIGNELELDTYQGIPLIFTVRLANQRAANLEAENRSRRESIAVIQEKAAKGEISKDKAEIMLALARQTQEDKPVQIGNHNQGWEQFIHLEARTSGGNFSRLQWPIAALSVPESKSVLLNASSVAEIQYALPPDAARQIAVGNMEVISVLEVPEGAGSTPGGWSGRVESVPVQLNIRQSPAKPSPAEGGIINLQTADYYAARGEWPSVLTYADKAVVSDPKLIRAHMRVGDAKEAQGDLKGALEAYQKALKLFYEQYPDSYDGPQFLIHKISELDAKLK